MNSNIIKLEKQKIILSRYDDSGIIISYTKSREMLSIHGWYDHIVGIEGNEISFIDFCKMLGIEKKTLKNALKEIEK